MCADRGFPARRLCRRRQSLFPRNLAVKAACSRRDQATHRTESGPVRMPSQRRPRFTPAGGKHLSVTISLDRRVERCAQTADFPYERLCRRRQSLFPRVAGGRRLASPKIPSDTGDSRRVEAAGLRESKIYTSRESQVNNSNLL